ELEVPFNRMIIQQTRVYTLHCYDPTNFPENNFRTSVATYAYTIHRELIEKPRTTDWFAKKDQPIKRMVSSIYGPAVKIKNYFFGSATAKNQYRLFLLFFMKIGIDAKWLFSKHISGRLFIQNVLPELIGLEPGIEWHIFLSDKDKDKQVDFPAGNVTIHYAWGGFNMLSNLFVIP